MARLVQHKPFPEGDATFEAQRQAIVESVLAKIPKEVICPTALSTIRHETSQPFQKNLTSVEVATAFCKKACIAHQLPFCLTGLYMTEALEQAKHLDEHLARTGKPVGPLHGIPISIKEMIPVKGQLQSLAGAVFYVKTHQPTAVFSTECTSSLGRTLNPHNLDLSPGGSSGGEGALLAVKGSVLGLGTDLGGSIRAPASFSGVYGLKGSHGFYPVGGMIDGPFPIGLSLQGIVGPMARTLRDLDYINRVVRQAKPWLRDPEALPLPYSGLQDYFAGSKLKIGLLKDYGSVQPQPPVAQAFARVQEQLLSAGFTLMPFTFHDPAQAHRLYSALALSDSWNGVRNGLAAGNEPPAPMLDSLVRGLMLQDPDHVPAKLEDSQVLSAKRSERDVFRAEFLSSRVKQGDPDIVIAPMSPAAAHDTGDFDRNVSQTQLWNVLHYPAIVVPIPFRVGKKAEYDPSTYQDMPPLSEADEGAKQLWEHHDYNGAPMTLSIVSKRYIEAELFGALGQIQDALKLP